MSHAHSKRIVGHLERKKSGLWYIVIRTKEEFKAINTGTKERDEAQRMLDAHLEESRRQKEMSVRSVPLAKVWNQYESSPNAYRHPEKLRQKKRSAWLYFAEWMQETHPEVDEASKITEAMANEYMNHYREGHSAGTSNNKMKFFSGMFDALQRDGIVSRNPWKGVRMFPKDGNTRREFTSEEVGRILSEAGAKGAEWRDLITIGLYTGLRLGDCCLLDWKDIDLAHMIIQVIPRKTARYAYGQPVTIPIHPELLEMLMRSPADSRTGHVLPTMPDLYFNHNSSLIGGLRTIFTAAGIETSIMLEGRKRPTPHATFHSLRHSFVSFATNSGVPIPVVQAIVGHHSSAMTRHYYHANEEALRKAVDAVPDFEDVAAREVEPETPEATPAQRSDEAEASVRQPPRAQRQSAPAKRQTPAMRPQPPQAAKEPPKQPMPYDAKPAAQGGGRSLVERMKEAATLFKEGMISEQEFTALRRQILATA